MFQHLFDGSAYDLAMYLPGGIIKRVTFGGTPLATCHYRAMALVAGGEWGWHLAWVVEGNDVLRYARMDGDAWVLSPAKKLSNNIKISTQLHIFTFEQKTWIVWGESTGTSNHIYAVHSDDEGRTWNSPQLITQVSSVLDEFAILVKDDKLHLQYDDISETLLLPE